MPYQIRPARRSEAKPLIGLYSESGCGKTYGALLLAKGFTGDMSTVGMIETESGRGEVFADDPIIGGYQVISMRDDFSPKNYGQAIDLANHSNLKALIIDSASHEWEGAGGVLGMAAANQAGGKKGPLVWQQPKMDHQREFMLRLMQTPIPLVIVCMRAKYPMKETVSNGKKEWTRSTELDPKQSEDILFEMMVHAWIDKQHLLHPTKYTKDELKSIFLDGKMITVETGQKLAEWAKGITKPLPTTAPAPEVLPQGNVASEKAKEKVNQKQLTRLFAMVHKDIPKESVKLFLMHYYSFESSKDITSDKYEEIITIVSDKAKFDIMMKDIAA
ncbi:MAG: ATP-binding protein [Clostridia bacterium]|jgi:hypothetical protein